MIIMKDAGSDDESGSEKESKDEEDEEEEEEDDDDEDGKFPGSKLIKGSFSGKLHKWTKEKKRMEINL